ncbi:Guanyl-specific ribonuclease Sa3 precursor [Streptomyces sp. YIM 130001]|uniref:ribonuclease domain-containing protein n=1 Tax=Streptomyces sp. YIM 130001 TaxID=2259644 RepID=UPI000E649EA2|nr:ribonuclease [Streptomyces sp. YIM 130001]RII08122.1 Guanyl-specific ribonuclease Sa3 precursor [Streptomyces sp. YIM 130001]
MRIPPRIATGIALAAALVVGGPVAAQAAPTSAAPVSATVSAGAVAAVGDICQSELPAEAHDTLELIEAGGPYPYPQDGTVFQNREGLLPDQSSDYYHEFTVETPGSPDRGARRIVTGESEQEDYYTADHYESFDLVDYAC